MEVAKRKLRNAQISSAGGATGIDRMVGGAGNDVYSVDVMGDLVVEAWNGGIDTVRTVAFVYGLSANVENLIGTATLYGQTLLATIWPM